MTSPQLPSPLLVCIPASLVTSEKTHSCSSCPLPPCTQKADSWPQRASSSSRGAHGASAPGEQRHVCAKARQGTRGRRVCALGDQPRRERTAARQLPKATGHAPRAQPGLIPSPWVSTKAQAGFIKQTACPSAGPGLRALRPRTLMLPRPLGWPVSGPVGWAPGPGGTVPRAPRPPAGGWRAVWGSKARGQGRRRHVLHFGDTCAGGRWRSGPLTAPGPNRCPRGSSRSPQQHPGRPEALASGPPGSPRRPPDVGVCPRGPASCVGRGAGQWGETKGTGTQVVLTL